MKLRYNLNINEDCTSNFTVEDYPEKLCDFIGEVLDKYPKRSGYFSVNSARIEYEKGHLVGRIPEDLLGASVVCATGIDAFAYLYFFVRTNVPRIYINILK